MSLRTIIIDPGHGGINADGKYVTAGKRYVFNDGRKVYEGARMRVLAGLLSKRLRALGFVVVDSLTGAEVVGPWAPTHVDVSLSQRVANSRHFNPRRTLFLSLHSNAISNSSAGVGQTKARGISVYTSEGETGSDPVATALHESLAASSTLPMRSQAYADGDPDYEAGFYVLRKTACMAVLVELGFHDHPIDAAALLDDEVLAQLADALAEGCARAA